MKILVTGAGGFIGSHVVEELLDQGFEVIALCKYNSAGSYGWLEGGKYSKNPKLDLILGDITDVEFVSMLVKKSELIINLAALIGIPYSYIAPRSYMNVNLLGVLNLLESARVFGKKLIQISTSEVYGNPVSVPIKTSHPIQPQSPYAASKAAADFLCKSYVDSFESQVVIVRPFNTFGPRQSLRAIIPTILTQIASGSGAIKLGSIGVKRDFTFVTDTAKGIVLAAKSNIDDGRVIQLGTGISVSIEELLGICSEALEKSFSIEWDQSRVRPGNSEIQILESDPSSASTQIDWSHKVDLRKGILETYEWIMQSGAINSRSEEYFV